VNSLISIEKPTKATALAALADMKEPAVWVPGAGAVIVLFLLAQNVLFCAAAVGITLYLNRLWSRLGKKP
jgi:hypothetical protein